MTEIKSTEEFNSLVKAFRIRNQKPLTNCFLMPQEIDTLAKEGRLLAEDSADWLLFLCDRDDYYSLYYYTTENSSSEAVKDFVKTVTDKDVYTDIVSRSGRGDMLTPAKLISDGAAEKYKTYQRMQVNTKDIDFSSLEIKLPEGYSLSLDYCDCEKLGSLWREALDEKSTPLPKQDELITLRDEGHLFTVLSEKGELAAVIVLSVTGKQSLLQHLSVSPDHRRKGLAAALMKKCLLCAKQEELTVSRLWVDCENLSAVALYDRLNFQKDGMLCEQLYMKGI